MKKALILVAALAIALPCLALADTVWVETQSSIDAGAAAPANESKTSTAEYAFRPEKPEITVKVANKMCVLRSSAAGSVPMGCNYTITVAADGSVSGELRAGNMVCTQTPDIAKSCQDM